MQEQLGERFPPEHFGEFKSFIHGSCRLVEVHFVYRDDAGTEYRFSKGIDNTEQENEEE